MPRFATVLSSFLPVGEARIWLWAAVCYYIFFKFIATVRGPSELKAWMAIFWWTLKIASVMTPVHPYQTIEYCILYGEHEYW